MKKILIELNLEEYDQENQVSLDLENIFIRQFEYDGSFADISNQFYPALGEGILITSDSFNDIEIINVKLIGQRDLSAFEELLNQLKEVSVDQDYFYREISNIDLTKYIQIEDEDFKDIEEIKTFLDLKKVEYRIVQNAVTYERGASGFFSGFLVGFSANIATEVFKEIIIYLKSRYKSNKFLEADLTEKIKTFIIKEYNLKPTDLFLSKIELETDGIYSYTFRTKKLKINVEVSSKNGEIIKLVSHKK